MVPKSVGGAIFHYSHQEQGTVSCNSVRIKSLNTHIRPFNWKEDPGNGRVQLLAAWAAWHFWKVFVYCLAINISQPRDVIVPSH